MTTKDRASEQAETQPVASNESLLALFAEAGVWVDGDDCTGGLLQDEVIELIRAQITEIARLKTLAKDMVEAWDWWQVDSYDRCQSVPGDAVDALRTELAGKK